MASFRRLALTLMTGCASLGLAACDGADSVASPGEGGIIITPPATPTPTPTPTATPTAGPVTTNFSTAGAPNTTVVITADQQVAVVNAGANNNLNGTAPLNGLVPQGGAATATVAQASALGAFFTNTSYIGAIAPGGTDTSFQGWTCNSSAANFGAGSTSCLAVPTSPGAAAASACPTGTTAVANPVNNYRLCTLPQQITTDLSLPNIPGVAYRFSGVTEVGVDRGIAGTGGTAATLTVAAGVILAADSSDAANDVILVNRGSRISAVGTASAPIIFTAQQNLNPTGTSDASQGLWGGIILLGRAPTGVCRAGTGPNDASGGSATCENGIEGVANRFYGGTAQADSSGTMSFVQIRYSGIAISEGNELQGLTLGGVGSGTTLDHIQSHNSADDGVEIFGGTANLRYVALTGADDDGFDTDNGWRGFVQFMVVAQKAVGATSDSFGFEIDSNGSEGLLPRQFGRIANLTLIQTASAPAAIRLRGGADYSFVNSIIKSVGPCLNIVAGETGADGLPSTISAANAATQEAGPPSFSSIYFACNGR